MGVTLAAAFAMIPIFALLYFQPWKGPLERVSSRMRDRRFERKWRESYDAELERTGDKYDATIAAMKATWSVKGPRGLKLLDEAIEDVERRRREDMERRGGI